MSSNSISQHERHGAWVPASAGTTPMLSPLTTHHPSSPRTRGPITTDRQQFCAEVIEQHLSTRATRRVGPCVRRDDTDVIPATATHRLHSPSVVPAQAGTQ